MSSIPQPMLRVVLALLPLALALVLVAAGASLGWIDNVLYLRADLGTLALIIGVGVSVLLGVGLLLQLWFVGRYNLRLDRAHVEAEEQLAGDRRRFLQRLDHELKNPLTAIRAGVANLAEAPESTRSEAIGSISAQATRLSQLVADLRKLAELETRPIEKAPVDWPICLTKQCSRPGSGRRRRSGKSTLMSRKCHGPSVLCREIAIFSSWRYTICWTMPSSSRGPAIRYR